MQEAVQGEDVYLCLRPGSYQALICTDSHPTGARQGQLRHRLDRAAQGKQSLAVRVLFNIEGCCRSQSSLITALQCHAQLLQSGH